MNTKPTMATVVTMVLFALGVMTVAASGEEVGSTATKEVPAAAQTSGPVATVVYDETSDVANPKLDIRKIKVVNTTSRVKVKVFFPGVAKTYDFPLGAISVFLDTEAQRAGPEYGHFMDFFSDYRFAVTDRWRRTPRRSGATRPKEPASRPPVCAVTSRASCAGSSTSCGRPKVASKLNRSGSR